MNKSPVFPFVAIVGQEKMKLSLILNIINPTLSGVLIRGEKGTAKSTAVRALAEILPAIQVVKDCPFQLFPDEARPVCRECAHIECSRKVMNHEPMETVQRGIRVVELPVGATEDRVVGTMDLEHALKKGEKRMEPGLLAAAHRGILYVDEVNLLDDHVVDVLLDSAAMGVNTIEREGVSFSHPARFTLVGTMNPEEGELRPQLLDRFGLCVHIEGINDPAARVAIMERRLTFDESPEDFCLEWEEGSRQLVKQIERAIDLYPHVIIDHALLYEIASFCLDVGVDGHRGDIIILKAAKTLAAFHGRTEVLKDDIDTAAELALPHRIRRQPLQDIVVEVDRLRRQKQAHRLANA
ncbi:ATP-binding protein [Desulfobacca acetoxidans]|uniref:Mg-protoporphyrin IX chelatase n=1 Tax=Desulfobacca acetoxidans (strain ATCC 700848 / DSM 11109 / ASRB2) TaxID=880072 RepID=F2NIC2_DESAR|nr:ATP-binding protein [Desulfobacca acetoxidans]AEB10324.1 Magnesium chelatase [Desulfobacca acetoxidans DSM 11109]HAY20734.1 magnesium chelatase ATPase subunit I [Desulfobacterales bacterium]